MRTSFLLAAALILPLWAVPSAAQTPPASLSPGEMVAKAPAADWHAIDRNDLLVMDLAPDAKGKARRVVIQLLPAPFSQGWIGNIRKLAAKHWWDGLSVNRVQDNYVVQWGDANGDDKAKAKPLPVGLVTVPESQYETEVIREMTVDPNGFGDQGPPVPPIDLLQKPDAYSTAAFSKGWPVGVGLAKAGNESMWPVHCYGMVGVGRDMPPDTGTGAELYTVIGHAPRHLDRNIALVGRVIEGIEHLSSLPRGHGDLGFYESAKGDKRVPIRSVRLGSEVPGLPGYQYLSTDSASFAGYADARANRRDAFFIHPAGGADICNIPVPVRRVK